MLDNPAAAVAGWLLILSFCAVYLLVWLVVWLLPTVYRQLTRARRRS